MMILPDKEGTSLLDRPETNRRKTSDLLMLALTQAILLIALFFYINVTASLVTVLLSFFGLVAISLSLFIVISSDSHPQASLGVWFVVLLSLTHGGGWILEKVYTDQHYSRVLSFTDATLSKSVILAGIGLLAFSGAYSYRRASQRGRRQGGDCMAPSRNSAIDGIPWSILWVWGIGILLFEIAGGMNLLSGYSLGTYIARSIFGYLSRPVVVLISVKLLASHSKARRTYLILGGIWAVYVLLTGQRQHIIAVGLSTLALSSKWRLTEIKLKHLVLLGVFLLSMMISVFYLRESYGRNTFTDTTLLEQVSIMSDHPSFDPYTARQNLEYDLGYRLNAGNILLGLIAEQPIGKFLWLEPLTYSMAKLVPGLVWTGKGQDVVGELPRLIGDHFRVSNRADYIATYITVFYAMGRLPMLVFGASVCGILIASLDTRLAQSHSRFSLIMAIGVALGFLTLDHSINMLFLSLRDSLLLYLVIEFSVRLLKSSPGDRK